MGASHSPPGWPRRDVAWNVGIVGSPGLPLLIVQYVTATAGPAEADPIRLALITAGWRPIAEASRVDTKLTIAGDHMEGDWIGSGDPDTCEDLSGMDDWLELALRLGEVAVITAPGILDRSEQAGQVVYDGALAAIVGVRSTTAPR